MNDEQLLKKRFIELGKRCYDIGHFVFTDFLGLNELSLLSEVENEIGSKNIASFGGHQHAERLMIRFGDPAMIGYEETFPISCLKIEPIARKFSDPFTHRDVLGSVMGLGIERSSVGDIILSENVGYLFCVSRMSGYIKEHLTQIKRTNVSVSLAETIPDSLVSGEEIQVQVPSRRIDAVISKAYHLSRKDSVALFQGKKVFIEGRQCENTSRMVKEGEIISVRGYGRITLDRELSVTRKGNLVLTMTRYR